MECLAFNGEKPNSRTVGWGEGGNLLTRSAQLEAADTYSAQSNDSPAGGRMSQEAAGPALQAPSKFLLRWILVRAGATTPLTQTVTNRHSIGSAMAAITCMSSAVYRTAFTNQSPQLAAFALGRMSMARRRHQCVLG